MRRLSLGIPLLLILLFSRTSDSPHGNDFKMSCTVCHSSEGWKYDASKSSFNHSKTSFALSGQHAVLNCRSCHVSLVFTGSKTACASCHKDIHEQTVGDNCARCHTTQSWLVSNISALHRQGRFPLVGAHSMADCQQCHKSTSLLRFDPLGVQCIDCHQSTYNSTSKPNHISSGFSTSCEQCHKVNAYLWDAKGFNHDFFPLTLGHNINECSKCHTNGTFSGLSPICLSCHQQTYNTTNNPNHASANFSTDCKQCHTTNPGWTPANFDHSLFPLTGGHNIADCSKCHINGNYTNTPTNCVACHQTNYNNTHNPNHATAGFSTDCKLCHTTNLGWSPATIDHSFFPLTLGHNIDCSKCHINGNYTNTPTACVACHQTDFNNTTNPNHSAAGYGTDCKICHLSTTPGWPATFNHTWFPIYSGKHKKGVWNTCADCHTNSSNYAVFTCITCHTKNSTDNNHNGVSGYQYNSNACYSCHPNGGGGKK
ncbi:MAG: hypothetical protein WCO63_13405 [Bacteroidota bacterium]